MLQIPFSIVPFKLLMPLAARLGSLAGFITAFFPSLKTSLLQARIELPAKDYTSIALAVSFTNTTLVFSFVFFLGILLKTNLLIIALLASLFLGLASFSTILIYPLIISTKRTRQLESNLIPATRQLLIELRSGVTLFSGMTSISSDYGEVSREFRKIILKINSGVPELDALADATRENPSQQFKKLLWQISNSLKVGGDVADAIEAILHEFTREKVNEIRKYGQELSPWTMIYMMAAVVLPSLGITMIIVIGSFLSISIPNIVLPGILVFLLGFQLFFLNFVGSRRPTV